ncbi:hypothetical protein GEMRC1_004065 [Eukaryota sp. GEM-RC1]
MWVFEEVQSDEEAPWCDLIASYLPEFTKLDVTVPKNESRVKVLVLLEFLIRLLGCHFTDLRSPKVLRQILGEPPAAVYSWLVDNFLGEARKTRQHGSVLKSWQQGFFFGQEGKSKAQLLAAILYMHINDFSCDPSPLCAAIKVSLSTGLFIFKQIGCKVRVVTEGIGKTSSAVLVAPLVLPDNYNTGRKFKRQR